MSTDKESLNEEIDKIDKNGYNSRFEHIFTKFLSVTCYHYFNLVIIYFA